MFVGFTSLASNIEKQGGIVPDRNVRNDDIKYGKSRILVYVTCMSNAV